MKPANNRFAKYAVAAVMAGVACPLLAYTVTLTVGTTAISETPFLATLSGVSNLYASVLYAHSDSGRMLTKAIPSATEYHSKTRAVRDHLASVPGRFVLHFMPTHPPWLNLVERWFAGITNKHIRRGGFESVPCSSQP